MAALEEPDLQDLNRGSRCTVTQKVAPASYDGHAAEAARTSEVQGGAKEKGVTIMPSTITYETVVPIKHDADVLIAYQKGRTLAAQLGLSSDDQTVVVIAILEVARNIIRYAEAGEIVLSTIKRSGEEGIAVVARDAGPGIPDVGRALKDGYSTGGGLGLGLPGARRLMDEFEIVSEVGKGTTIEMRKWKR